MPASPAVSVSSPESAASGMAFSDGGSGVPFHAYGHPHGGASSTSAVFTPSSMTMSLPALSPADIAATAMSLPAPLTPGPSVLTPFGSYNIPHFYPTPPPHNFGPSMPPDSRRPVSQPAPGPISSSHLQPCFLYATPEGTIPEAHSYPPIGAFISSFGRQQGRTVSGDDALAEVQRRSRASSSAPMKRSISLHAPSIPAVSPMDVLLPPQPAAELPKPLSPTATRSPSKASKQQSSTTVTGNAAASTSSASARRNSNTKASSAPRRRESAGGEGNSQQDDGNGGSDGGGGGGGGGGASGSGAGGSGTFYRPTSRVSRACTACRRQKMRCDGMQPCKRCVRAGHECTFEKPTGPTSGGALAASAYVQPLQIQSQTQMQRRSSRTTDGGGEMRQESEAGSTSMDIDTSPTGTAEMAGSLVQQLTAAFAGAVRRPDSNGTRGFTGGYLDPQEQEAGAAAAVAAQLIATMPGFSSSAPISQFQQRLEGLEVTMKGMQMAFSALNDVLRGSPSEVPDPSGQTSTAEEVPTRPGGPLRRGYSMNSTIGLRTGGSSLVRRRPRAATQSKITALARELSAPGTSASNASMQEGGPPTSAAGDLPNEHLSAPIAALRGLADAAAIAAKADGMSESTTGPASSSAENADAMLATGKRAGPQDAGQAKRARIALAWDSSRRTSPSGSHADEGSSDADVVELGLISEARAREMFGVFGRVVPTFISIFPFESVPVERASGDWFEEVRDKSILLFNTVVAIGCLIAQENDAGAEELYHGCIKEARKHAQATLFHSASPKESIQAVILLSAYSDNGWLACGHATRMSQDAGLDKALGRLLIHLRGNQMQPTDKDAMELSEL